MREALAALALALASSGCSQLEPQPAWVAPPVHAAEATAESPAEPPGPVPGGAAEAVLPAGSEGLLEHGALILEALDRRSYALAARETQRLAQDYPDNPEARLLQVLFERRLAQLKSSDASAASASLTARRLGDQARGLIRQGRNEEARLLLERAHGLDAEDSDVAEDLVALLKQMGVEIYGSGDADKASALWRRALEIRPNDPEAKRFLQRADAVKTKI
jgi:tetratricopeptide (TPR) repeat protein